MKTAILFFAKIIGLFEIASWLTRDQIRILAYHGIWFLDGHYGNFLYMNPDKFQARMSWLKQSKYSVISLDEAVKNLEQNQINHYSIVITIDDGWYGTYQYMMPVFKENELPATLYVYTEAVESQKPLLNILIPAIFQLTDKTLLKTYLKEINESLEIDISDSEKKQKAAANILERLLALKDTSQKENFCRDIATALGFDYEAILQSRQFGLMTFDEIQKANQCGLDIQLHTHTHHLDTGTPEKIVSEITINRNKLKPYVTSSLEHFCYPSGVHSTEMHHYLQTNDVISATLCDTGFATPQNNVFALNRILDGQQISQLEFEGEISGFFELIRKLKRKFSGSTNTIQ